MVKPAPAKPAMTRSSPSNGAAAKPAPTQPAPTRPSLSEFSAVIAVADHGSFRAAARALAMSASALSHAIATLEARIGVRLFNRTTRSVSLTDAGAQFVARVAPALRELGAAVEAVNDFRDRPTGLLRINTSEGAARQFLSPVVFGFLGRYPDMRVDLATEGRLVDIVADGFDAGVRLLEAVPRDMIAVPIGPQQRFVVVGSPGYFARRPRPTVPADLVCHDCIRSRMPSGAVFRWEFEKRGEQVLLDVAGPLTLDNQNLRLEAALAGVGLAYLTEWDVSAAVADGRLVRVLDDWTAPFPGLAIYYPGHRHVPAGLRAFIDFAKEVF